jgi:hypothetical protein
VITEVAPHPETAFDPIDWVKRWAAWGGEIIVHDGRVHFQNRLDTDGNFVAAEASKLLFDELAATPGGREAVRALFVPPSGAIH